MKAESAKDYWENRYLNKETGWDIGYPSTPLVDFFKTLEDKNISILIPGAGNGYEVEYLFNNGFTNVHLLDFSAEAIKGFKNRVPGFPDSQLHLEDFFDHEGIYDLII